MEGPPPFAHLQYDHDSHGKSLQMIVKKWLNEANEVDGCYTVLGLNNS